MHPDIRKLNKKDPPPEGHQHPAYELQETICHTWTIAYLDKGKWNMPTRTFETEALALRWLLDKLYYE